MDQAQASPLPTCTSPPVREVAIAVELEPLQTVTTVEMARSSESLRKDFSVYRGIPGAGQGRW